MKNTNNITKAAKEIVKLPAFKDMLTKLDGNNITTIFSTALICGTIFYAIANKAHIEYANGKSKITVGAN